VIGWVDGDQNVPSIQEIWFIEPERTWVKVLRWTSAGWTELIYEGLDGVLTYGGAAIPLAEVYAKTVT
jgi:hypothetical protein